MIIIRSQDKTDLVKADWINVDKEYVYAMFGYLYSNKAKRATSLRLIS